MRIIAGEFRGRTLRAPPGRGTRPTPDRVREALFSILGEQVADASVAELFGGTGALGLEALSRGALRAVFTETSHAARTCLLANIAALGVEDRTRLYAKSAFLLPRLDPGPFDIVFCDPPHRILDEAEGRRRVERLLAALPLSPDATVVLEHRAGALGDLSPPGLPLQDLRAWGSVAMAFYGPVIP